MTLWHRTPFFWDMTPRHWPVGVRRFEGTVYIRNIDYRLLIIAASYLNNGSLKALIAGTIMLHAMLSFCLLFPSLLISLLLSTLFTTCRFLLTFSDLYVYAGMET
jgi:hypothetical protein